MKKTVRDIMSTDCVTATTKDNIYEIAVLMKNHDIGFVPVLEGKKMIGVVTDRDLVVRGYAEKHSGSTAVSEVITNTIKTVSPDTTIDEAAKIMAANQIRRLPVVENGDLAGVIAIGDLAIREIFVNEAGDALSEISEHTHREPAAVH
ncbi:CBS domain-containing protein [Paenibacillus sambharensis]|uniref:CBS domain-containing protein n=1 Tax=Paenibacillus sambharensis TaxID=1803190 RepID=A0A2W1L3U9_9BACL|nr:CBS domain-containing protein [Paenibacillus sambharensis]PZD94026.1 CBS domain-containing protein [Paenibacillus sambharensis]